MERDDNSRENIIKCNYELTINEIFDIVTIENIDFLYNDNKLYSGKLILEYEEGKSHTDGYIKSGRRHGIWKYYYKSGSIRVEEEFDSGLRVKVK